jgi:hypothetical protein
MQSMLRSKLAKAVESVYEQQFDGTVQLLIGVDILEGDAFDVEPICRQIPDRHSILFFNPGYSTSRRHGGVHHAWDGGAMRTILSYMANSTRIAYLDDDNWWAPNHLSSMSEALAGADWAWAARWYVHPVSRRPICTDDWESVGPDSGFFDFLGGWVDPNCLAINKCRCEAVLRWWSIPRSNPMNADRNVFQILRSHFKGKPTNKATVFYEVSETDSMHPHRLEMIGEERYNAVAA